NHDVINLRPQPTNVFLHQEWIHGSDPRTAVRGERGFPHIAELRIANEADLDAIPLEDDRLSSFVKIVTAADMGNPGRRESAQRIQKPLFLRVKAMIIADRYKGSSHRSQSLRELLRRTVMAIHTGVIRQRG